MEMFRVVGRAGYDIIVLVARITIMFYATTESSGAIRHNFTIGQTKPRTLVTAIIILCHSVFTVESMASFVAFNVIR